VTGAAGAWILAYGSLVDPDDPLVRRLTARGTAVAGTVAGVRRTWTAGMENRARENDDKHYVDPSGGRPDVCVVTLSADPEPGRDPDPDPDPDRGTRPGGLNVVALPVDADGLARADRRERRYVRREVGSRFSVPLDGPVWIYTASERARADAAAAAAAGRAVVRRGYVDRVEHAFRARGRAPWSAYRASTDRPPHPLAELELVRPGVAPGE
jgi:hypothetical protein